MFLECVGMFVLFDVVFLLILMVNKKHSDTFTLHR